MKAITLKQLKYKILSKFETEEEFVSWWLQERSKKISNNYPNKPIMKLQVDKQQILPILSDYLELETDKIVETSDYPTPPISFENYIRNYSSLFVPDQIENVMDDILEDITEIVDEVEKPKSKKYPKKKN